MTTAVNVSGGSTQSSFWPRNREVWSRGITTGMAYAVRPVIAIIGAYVWNASTMPPLILTPNPDDKVKIAWQ
jgi:hypothetical protein